MIKHISLKTLLREVKLYSYNTQELLDQFLQFENKTLIFFDTETTGLETNIKSAQLTQISALVVDGSTMKELENFDVKIKFTRWLNNLLNDPSSWEAKSFAKADEKFYKKYKTRITHPSELLKMTQYYSGLPATHDEKDALIDFEKFIGKFNNVVLIAHNATFDMKAIQARREKYNLSRMKAFPVMDTLKISRFFFVPILLSLEDNEEAKSYLQKLLNKTKYKSYSSSLGKLASVFQVKLDDWHNSASDVKMLLEILRKMIEYLRSNVNIDITKQKSLAAKRFRKF